MAITTALFETQYFPPVQYFSLLIQADEVMIEAKEHYQKRSYRNRCHLAGPNGPIRLSVPLLRGKNEQMPISEVQVAYRRPWYGEHWHSIRTAYGKAPFFEFYAEELRPLLYARPARLFDLNTELLRKLMELLQIDRPLHFTENYSAAGESGVIDCREAAHPKHPARAFRAAAYPQVFEDRHGFLPNLSILDLLFCTGPQAALLLQQFAEQNPLV